MQTLFAERIEKALEKLYRRREKAKKALNLLNLAPIIRHYILTLPPTKHHSLIGDRNWMKLARIQHHDLPRKEFDRLVGSTPTRSGGQKFVHV